MWHKKAATSLSINFVSPFIWIIQSSRSCHDHSIVQLLSNPEIAPVKTDRVTWAITEFDRMQSLPLLWNTRELFGKGFVGFQVRQGWPVMWNEWTVDSLKVLPLLKWGQNLCNLHCTDFILWKMPKKEPDISSCENTLSYKQVAFMWHPPLGLLQVHFYTFYIFFWLFLIRVYQVSFTKLAGPYLHAVSYTHASCWFSTVTHGNRNTLLSWVEYPALETQHDFMMYLLSPPSSLHSQ